MTGHGVSSRSPIGGGGADDLRGELVNPVAHFDHVVAGL
jgi:hypothetical protein